MTTLAKETKIPQEQRQTEERRMVASRALTRLREMDQERVTRHPLLRNRTPMQAMEDSLKRLAQYKPRPDYKQWWQSNLAGSIITDKLFTTLSKLAARAMEFTIVPDGDASLQAQIKARILNTGLRGAGRLLLDDFMLIMELLEAMGKGMVVGFEGWKRVPRKSKFAISIDPETGEEKYMEEEYYEHDDVWGDIWPAEHVLFGNINVNHVQKMSDIGLERVVKWDQWRNEYKGWPDADKVQPRGNVTLLGESSEFWTPDWVARDEVHEVRYYNQDTNEFILMANGIWINSMGKASLRPIPYTHGKLPVWLARYRPLRQDYLRGMSHPDTMISASDSYDKVMDGALDNINIALNAPIVVDEQTKRTSSSLWQPNKFWKLKAGQKAPERVKVDGIAPAHIQFLSILRNRLEQNASSSDLGAANKTATQVAAEVDVAMEMATLSLQLMEYALRDKMMLRGSNWLQYNSLPGAKGRYRTLTVRDEVLQSGKVGTRVIKIVKKPDQKRAMMESMTSPGQPEVLECTPSFLRQEFHYDLIYVPGSSKYRSETIMQTMELNKQRVLAALHPEKFMKNSDRFYNDILKAFRLDTERYNQQDKQPQAPSNGEKGALGGPGANPPPGRASDQLLNRGGAGMPAIPKEPTLKEVVGG